MLTPILAPPAADLSPADRERIYGVTVTSTIAVTVRADCDPRRVRRLTEDTMAALRDEHPHMVRRDPPQGEARPVIARADDLPTAPGGPLSPQPE